MSNMEKRRTADRGYVFFKSRLESRMTPRLRADSVWLRETYLKKMEVFETLDRCCGVPISRCSVFEGLMTRRFAQSQEWTCSRLDVSYVRATLALVLEKET